MDLEKLLEKQKLCITEEPSPCTAKCPLHVDVKGVMEEVESGNFEKAYKILVKRQPFPKLFSRICDRVCEDVCLRKDAGGAVSILKIERAAVEHGTGKPKRSFPVPRNNKRVAIIGSGISSLTAAVDLDKKGYSLSIYEIGERLGGKLWDYPEEMLPKQLIEEELESITNGMEKVLGTEIDEKAIERLKQEYDAVYIGTGQKFYQSLDMETFQTDSGCIFAGGRRATGKDSVVYSASSGRRAAVSIDRFIQKKSMSASREREGSYETPLKLDISEIEAVEAVGASDWSLSRQQAMEEASRCIKCKCTECMKACVHLRKFDILPNSYIKTIKHNEEIILGDHYANKMINSCMLCGLCEKVCPADIDMGEIIRETRTSMVEREKMPVSAHEFALMDMEFSLSDSFALLSHQRDRKSSGYLFFPGCQLSASHPEYVLEAYEYLKAKTNEGMGIYLGCCGAPAEWAGRDELFRGTIEGIKKSWEEMGRPVFINSCPTCMYMMQRYAPEIECTSLLEFIDEHGLPEGKSNCEGKVFAIHDSCTARENDAIQESARSILAKLGCGIEELKNSRQTTKCCGYGGLAYYANSEQAEEAISERNAESESDYVSYCAMCRDMFASKGKRSANMLDLIFSSDLEQELEKKGPKLWERRTNRSMTKALLQKAMGIEANKPEGLELEIVLDYEAEQAMQNRWILLQDVERVLLSARETGDVFENLDGKSLLARKRIGNVTYWVEYEMDDDVYVVRNAYSHRMEVVEE